MKVCECCGQQIQEELQLQKTDKEVFFDFWLGTLGQEECEKSWETKQTEAYRSAPMVMSDIEGYTSMVDGSWISSRSHHRNHLKEHRMFEVGNEKQAPKAPPKRIDDPRRTERIARAVYDKLEYGKNGKVQVRS